VIFRTDEPGPGRVAVSVGIAAFLGIALVQVLPPSPIRAKIEPRIVDAERVGLEQGWGCSSSTRTRRPSARRSRPA
jgi:hypothetical protein